MRPLRQYITKGGKRLRMGYTTGSCAAAAAHAAALLLLVGERIPAVLLRTPGGLAVPIDIETAETSSGWARCTVIKDGGDDPDVTDGAVVGCTVSRIPAGWTIDGGEGVGRVTRPGLACPVGDAAINPVPRAMIAAQLEAAAARCDCAGGLRAVVDIPEGRALAAKTFNPRLGIVGGLSILGTTGLVEPMSEAALVATIHAELDSLAAGGGDRLLVVPGNYGRDFARQRWGLSLERGVKCSNYIGETLDHAVYKGFRRVLLLGHAGKLIKLAAGIMHTHSRVADGRMEVLTAHAGLCGVGPEKLAALMDCVTIDAADDLLTGWGVADAVWAGVGERVRFHLEARVGAGVEIAFAAFARRGVVMSHGDIDRHSREWTEGME